jgi:hypothetical protein
LAWVQWSRTGGLRDAATMTRLVNHGAVDVVVRMTV